MPAHERIEPYERRDHHEQRGSEKQSVAAERLGDRQGGDGAWTVPVSHACGGLRRFCARLGGTTKVRAFRSTPERPRVFRSLVQARVHGVYSTTTPLLRETDSPKYLSRQPR